MPAVITQSEAKQQLNGDIERMCAQLRLSKCEAAIFGGHFADYANGRNGYDQTILNIRHKRESLREDEMAIQHLPNCKCASRPVSPAIASAYAELGLAPGAPVELIKAAYKALAGVRHPDKGGSTEAMTRLNLAYRTLTK